MKNLLLSVAALIGILFLSNCEFDDHKVNVCHKGKVICISVHGIKAHKAHGDAIDKDGDGYFDIDNKCSETDCDDTDPNVYPGAEDPNGCNGAECSITLLEVLNATCGDTESYGLQYRVTYSNAPATGTLNVTLNGELFTYAITSSPQTVNAFGLPATGTGVDVVVNFSDDPSCELAIDDWFTAPDCGTEN